VETKVVLGAKSTRGLGSGGDPERGRAAAEEEIEQLRDLCTGADVVFVVAGLGGGTGTGAGPVVARVAKEAGALVLGVVVLPFDCEGTRRQRQAQLGLQELKEAADGVICLPNQKVFKLIDENTSLLEAFAITNELVAQGVRGIWRLLARPGLINVDYADLCSVTKGRHSESALASAEARGENRAREVVEKILAHPLIEGGLAFTEAAGILVCIAGGRDLTMAEVNRIMEQISRHTDQVHIIMGASVFDELEDKLMVTVVASRRSGAVTRHGPVPPEDDGAGQASAELAPQMVETSGPSRATSRFNAPPPPTTPEKTEQLLNQQPGVAGRSRKGSSRLRQGQLQLEIISKGRFEKSEPTIHQGQDLDVPTYIRRGVALN
jgi:cell division protein FtsZ